MLSPASHKPERSPAKTEYVFPRTSELVRPAGRCVCSRSRSDSPDVLATGRRVHPRNKAAACRVDKGSCKQTSTTYRRVDRLKDRRSFLRSANQHMTSESEKFPPGTISRPAPPKFRGACSTRPAIQRRTDTKGETAP